MTLEKNLKDKKAQSTVEYLVLFAIIALLALLSITQMFPRLQAAGEDYFTKSVNALE